jgi:triosephosphate isomerase (TIM)
MPVAKPVVIGNWKMNGLRAEGEALVTALLERYGSAGGNGTLGVCPPATLLVPLAGTLAGTRIRLGAQDCHPQPKGAFTGDISAPMVKDAGCEMVIVGHSERRQGHGETDELVRAKAKAALDAGLIAIVCIGETEQQWQAGETLAVLDAQLEGSLPEGASAESLILAYEPVWAIGTGRTPTTEDVARTHDHLRRRLAELVPDGSALRLLYGGSVKAKNAREIMALANVDGVLVGGASLDSNEFWAIYEAGRAARG